MPGETWSFSIDERLSHLRHGARNGLRSNIAFSGNQGLRLSVPGAGRERCQKGQQSRLRVAIDVFERRIVRIDNENLIVGA